MRFTSPAFLSVFLITFVLAIPAPDKYIHHYEPGCPVVGAKACLLTDYCQYHRDRGDLFTTRNGELKSRDAPETENSDLNLKDALSLSSFTMRELAVKWKRTIIAKSVQCGTLSCVANREMSEPFSGLIAGRLYDLIVDYPYNGATGGKSGLFFPCLLRPQSSNFSAFKHH